MQAIELDRQRRHLEALDDRSFLREIGTWLMLAEEGRSSRWVLAELRTEYADALDAYHRDGKRTLLLLADIRERLAALAGRPAERMRRQPDCEEAAAAVQVLITAIRREVRNLQDDAAGHGAELKALVRRFDAIAAQHRRRHSDFVALMYSSASGSLRRLDWLAEEIELRQPVAELVLAAPAPSTLEHVLASVGPLLHAAVSGYRELAAGEERQLGVLVAGARVDAARVHEQMMRRAHAEEWSVQRHLGADVGESRRRARGRCG